MHALHIQRLAVFAAFGLLASSVVAADKYIVRVPANVQAAPASESTPPAEPLSVSLAAFSLPSGTVGKPYVPFDLFSVLSISEGGYGMSDVSWSLKQGTSLPPGLILTTDGKISGTPTTKNETGTDFEVVASYKESSGQQVYTIMVNGVQMTFTQISAGGYNNYGFTCGLTPEGGVWCWGDNSYRQLGINSQLQKDVPTRVVSMDSGVTQISAGYQHVCAVKEGEVFCWGRNYGGQLGDGTKTDRATPVKVINIDSTIVQVSAGQNATNAHSCAVSNDGKAWCWGDNYYGQLGFGDKTSKSGPVLVSGLVNPTRIAAGMTHTCAIDSGAVKCWGRNSAFGVLGNNETNDSYSPIPTSGLGSGVIDIDAGDYHTCALNDGGAVYCWGSDSYGQLGDNATLGISKVPVLVQGLESGVQSIAAGLHMNCAIKEGALWCWGRNANGTVGDGSTSAGKPVPVKATFNEAVTDVTVGAVHACAMTAAGKNYCWGSNTYGQFGQATPTSSSSPVEIQYVFGQ